MLCAWHEQEASVVCYLLHAFNGRAVDAYSGSLHLSHPIGGLPILSAWQDICSQWSPIHGTVRYKNDDDNTNVKHALLGKIFVCLCLPADGFHIPSFHVFIAHADAVLVSPFKASFEPWILEFRIFVAPPPVS